MKTRNYARFYVLLGRMPALDKDELKIQLVRQFTDGRTESLKEMTDKEYTAMCDGMQQQIGNYKSREIYREELRRKRSAVLHLLQKIGVDTTDWDRVNAYLRSAVSPANRRNRRLQTLRPPMPRYRTSLRKWISK